MKKILTIIAIIASLYSNGQTKFDKQKIAILKYNKDFGWPFSENDKPAKLNNEELKSINSILVRCVNEYNPKGEKLYNEVLQVCKQCDYKLEDFVIELNNYKRQYVPVINADGEKEVWINCFCKANHNWKKEIIIHVGGQSCYFNVLINLTRGSYDSFHINDEGDVQY